MTALRLGINCGVQLDGMFEYKATESLSFDLLDCDRMGADAAEIAAGGARDPLLCTHAHACIFLGPTHLSTPLICA